MEPGQLGDRPGMDRVELAKELFLQGLHSLLAEDYPKAEAKFLEANKLVPDRLSVLTNLSAALLGQGKIAEAKEYAQKSLAVDDRNAQGWLNLAECLEREQETLEALASIDRALVVKPDFAEAWSSRGNILNALKRYDDALVSVDKALALKPDFAAAWCSRGNVLNALKRYDDALASVDKALALKPDFAAAWCSRGNVLNALKRYDDALASVDKALALKPDLAEAWLNRANALVGLGRHDNTLASPERALMLKPDLAEASYPHPGAIGGLGRFNEALASLERAVGLAPHLAVAWLSHASVLSELRRHTEATQSLSKLLELAPDFPFAKGRLLHSRMQVCDWTHLTPLVESIRFDVQSGKASAEPFGYQAISNSLEDLKRCAEIFAHEKYPPAQSAEIRRGRSESGKIRVGYVSGEFRNQATSVLIAGLLERHDKDRFDVFAVDNGWDDRSELRRRIEEAVHELLDIRHLGDLAAADAIRHRNIDILINLNGYFGEGRQGVFAMRPSPIQVNYLGFPGTIGANYIDYVLADRIVIPPEHQRFYTEKVVYLPNSYQVNDAKRRIADWSPTRAEMGLPEAGFVFCCFNNNYKITPEIYDVWMRLLKRVPGSVLWLLEDNPAASSNLGREAEHRGVDAKRLVLAPRMTLSKHLARHKLADLFVDTLPYNAHTTASDALWAGLPLITCLGRTFPGRVASSLLFAVGLPELVTQTLDDYEALAFKLATDPGSLLEIKEKLLRHKLTCPLFDTALFTKNIESAYAKIWERYEASLAPDHIYLD
jgi:predicted O-linked N-acetylglucosamine transferase (SPINDLY family)